MAEPRQIHLPYAPKIAGLSFRLFRGAEDFPLMLNVAGPSETFDGEDHLVTLEDIARNYAGDYSCVPTEDVLMAEIDGKLVAYFKCWWYSERDDKRRLYVTLGFVLPEWRRKGLGRAALRWQEDHLRDIATSHPDSCERLFSLWRRDIHAGKASLFEQFGYKPVRIGQDMLRPTLEDIADFPLPDGIEIRPPEPAQYRAIWEACFEAFADHWGAGQLDDRDYQAWLDNPHGLQTELWQIAWDKASNEIAGQIRPEIHTDLNAKYNRRRGYIEEVAVRRPWRRKGLARALMSRSLQTLKAAGMTDAGLGVDSENLSGATKLYTDCGFQVVKSYITLRKPLE